MGLPEEQARPLNANHREICKYENPTSSAYISVCNALVSAVEPIVSKASSLHAEVNRRDMNVLGLFLGIFDKPEDDLKNEEDRAEGTCEWLVGKSSFMHWMEADARGPKMFWLKGNPASGKSVLSSHVIRYLEAANKECSYFFFQHGDKTRASTTFMLRSIAYQMALANAKVRKALLLFRQEENIKIEQADERTLWRKLYVSLIFKHGFDQEHFWVIDGFDECKDFAVLMSMLAKVDEKIPIRIFISSRSATDIDKLFQTVKHPTVVEHMSVQQTQADIRLYIKANIYSLPVETDQARDELTEKIVTKANDCFLWAHLVLRELEHTFSEQQINEVLDEVPKQMWPLYSRILDGMRKDQRNAELIKAILTWTVCATHPLRLDELKEALRLDLKMTISRLDRLIESSLGEMVYVDKHSRVQLIHPTAREFLLSRSAVSDFAIDAREGHT